MQKQSTIYAKIINEIQKKFPISWRFFGVSLGQLLLSSRRNISLESLNPNKNMNERRNILTQITDVPFTFK